jgi:hypothetical protein
LTGWIRLRLSAGSMPNHGEKNARDKCGFCDTFHAIDNFVIRVVPVGTVPTAYAILQNTQRCAMAAHQP